MTEANTLTDAGSATPGQTVADVILGQGTRQQQGRWLRRLAASQVVSAMADREPGLGHGSTLRTSAIRSGDHLVITGTKVTAPLTGSSWVLAVSCVTESSGSPGWIVAEVNDRTPGFHRGRMVRREGDRHVDVDILYFDELRVGAADLLGHDADV